MTGNPNNVHYRNRRIIALLIIGILLISVELFFRSRIHSMLANSSQQTMEITKLLDLKYPVAPEEHENNRVEAFKLSSSNGEYALLINKTNRILTVIKAGKPAEEMPVELGANPVSAKWLQGDNATPEGIYHIRKIKDTGHTSFHRAYLINYPSWHDRMKYLKAVLSGKVKPLTGSGNLIEIHGSGTDEPARRTNWTNGCIALSSKNMDILFEKYTLPTGTPVVIVR